MTKKSLGIAAILVVAAVALVLIYLITSTRSLSPEETASYSNNGINITVAYFRPSKRGRLIFGEESDGALQPNGKYWRLGANDATEITFSRDVTFAGMPLSAGTYRMYANLAATSWLISLNSELGVWGGNEPNHDLDVLKVEVPVERSSTVIEQFTISFDEDASGVRMRLAWDQLFVTVPIGVQ
jgi:hypothetical protein